MALKEDLVEIGLGAEESVVYLALLEIGKTSAGAIIKKTGLHRQTLYDTMEKLKRKSYVTESLKANRKYWTPAQPQIIVKKLRDTYELGQATLPHLLSLYKLSSHKQEVRVFEGVEGFKAAHKNNIQSQPKNTFVPVIGATGWNWVGTMQEAHYFKTYEKQRIEKNINHSILFLKRAYRNPKSYSEIFQKS